MNTGIRLFESKIDYNTDKLRDDLRKVESNFNYEDGYSGHSISILSKNKVSKTHRNYIQNLPFTNAIDSCPYFKKIYETFKTRFISMRLLRRKSSSSYKLHFDRQSKGVVDRQENLKIVRFQIPIVMNKYCHLCITSYTKFAEIGGRNSSNTRFKNYEEFKSKHLFRDCSNCFFLKPGILYHFNTHQIHTLFNDGKTDRVTLAFDLVINSWLNTWMKDNLEEVSQ